MLDTSAPAVGDAVCVHFPRRRRGLEGVVTEVAADGARVHVLFLLHAKHELNGASAWVDAAGVRVLPAAMPELPALRVGCAVKVRDDVDALRWHSARVEDVRVGLGGHLLFLVSTDAESREWRSADDVSPALRPQPAAPALVATAFDATRARKLEGAPWADVAGAADRADGGRAARAPPAPPTPAEPPRACSAFEGGGAAAAATARGGADAAKRTARAGGVPPGVVDSPDFAHAASAGDADAAHAPPPAQRGVVAERGSGAGSRASSSSDEMDASGDSDGDELQLNEAVVARWGRGSRAKEYDGIVVAQEEGCSDRLLIEFLHDQSRAWVARAHVRLMPATADGALPDALRVGSAVRALDPFHASSREPHGHGAVWHDARVVEARRGVGRAGEGAYWLWVQYDSSHLFQWVGLCHVAPRAGAGDCAPGARAAAGAAACARTRRAGAAADGATESPRRGAPLRAPCANRQTARPSEARKRARGEADGAAAPAKTARAPPSPAAPRSRTARSMRLAESYGARTAGSRGAAATADGDDSTHMRAVRARARGALAAPPCAPAAAELRLHEAVVATCARTGCARDGVVVDARGSRVLVEFFGDGSTAWVGEATVALMRDAQPAAVPPTLRAGCAVRAVDPCAPASSERGALEPTEPVWHCAHVIEVKQGTQARGEAGQWFWVRYDETRLHQWLSAEQLAGEGGEGDGARAESLPPARLLRLAAALRRELASVQAVVRGLGGTCQQAVASGRVGERVSPV
ncbi:hypothetical protein KFE25_003114 [Diacronema lutheri]|uniref:Uncharacterized protein n=1 Tax=Diacronema lutheri TaxID=2081491 RepID=A0A8J5XF47_DIALT|nr:hypothetical protein KFE25_003114 [Diacronema lutheri]